MRYEVRAYGSRAEIIERLTAYGQKPGLPESEMREAARCVVLLEGGADTVTFGRAIFHVEEQAP